MTIIKLMLRGGVMAALTLGSVAFAQMTEPQNKSTEPESTEPADATADEPDEAADEPVATQEANGDDMAKANAELDRVQATKTTKDKWDKCEEESHYAKVMFGDPTQAQQEAYKNQMACMGPEEE